MEEEVTKYMELPEELSFVKTSNGLKRKSNETKEKKKKRTEMFKSQYEIDRNFNRNHLLYLCS